MSLALAFLRWYRRPTGGGPTLTVGLGIGTEMADMEDELGFTASDVGLDTKFLTLVGWRFGGVKRQVFVEAAAGVSVDLAGDDMMLQTASFASYENEYEAGEVTPVAYVGLGYTF
jgi:hypothetical protein